MKATLYLSNNRHATWLELFFDLVFVAVIGVITHDLAHTHHGHISFEQLVRFPLVFIPVWWIWMTHTLFANRFDSDSREQRLVSLAIMGVLVVLSTLAETSLTEDFTSFVALYSLVRMILMLGYLHVHTQRGEEIVFAKDMALSIGIGAFISASSIFFDGITQYIVFYLGILIDVIWQIVLRNKTSKLPVDRVHLIERLGLLAIIILGESMIAMVGSLSDVSWQLNSVIGAVAGFALIGAIWWVYFDSFHILEKAKRLKTANAVIYSHLLLCMGLLILANLIRHAILEDLDLYTFSLLAITGLVFFYLGKQIPYWYAFPPWRKAILGNTIICVLVTVASTMLPTIQMSLVGMMVAILIYVYLTHKRILRVPVDQYID
ncbi:low temperature requirement protein A [Thalassotalea nanhaiensis]|uniref:Low temperature requirement protein A n=1 Tax=Thalassotalea nanhaiensis TaxID=3065648 RepID=A0ABY9TDZ9_9GAMM|nr:low temperature requirement protein A [Colwelliaceae bacterium SQ345]